MPPEVSVNRLFIPDQTILIHYFRSAQHIYIKEDLRPSGSVGWNGQPPEAIGRTLTDRCACTDGNAPPGPAYRWDRLIEATDAPR